MNRQGLTVQDFHEEGFFDIEENKYHAMPEISKSQLDLIDQAPAKYLYSLENTRESTNAMNFGKAFHCYLLEFDRFNDEYQVPFWGDRRTKKGKAEYNEWIEANPNAKIIKTEELSKLRSMKDSVMNHKMASKLLNAKREHTEVSMFWKHERTGLNCRSRPDIVLEDEPMLVDIKTTDDASPRGFPKSIMNYRYHVQDAFYSTGYHHLKGLYPDFYFIAVESKAPYLCAVYFNHNEARDKGEIEFENNLSTYKLCLEENNFPGYSNEIEEINLPRWAR